MTFQEFPLLVDKLRKKYDVVDVEMKVPSPLDINNFAVRIDVNIAKGEITEYGTIWYDTQHHTVDEVFKMLVNDIAGEMGEY